jgi:two-component system, NtrC family, sensor kinase
MRRKRRTVLRQVLLSYAGVTLLFAVVTGVNVLGQRQSVRETELMRSAYLPLALALHDAVASQDTFNTQLNHITDVRNPADKQVWFERALSSARPRDFAKMRAALTRAFGEQDAELRNELTTELGSIERQMRDDRDLLSSLFHYLKQNDRERAEKAQDDLVTRGTRAAGLLSQLESRVTALVDRLIESASARERLSLRLLWVWMVLSLVLGVAVALYARRLLRPLEQITERAKVVAEGDFTPQPPHAALDEIGDLSRTFEAMVSRIAQVNQQLLESERLATIGKMAAHVTHEVRNPLSSIALNLELLEDELPAEGEAHTLFVAIRREVERLTELTEQYLSVARRREPKFALENVAEVVAEAVEFMRPELVKHGIEVTVELEDTAPKVRIDEGQLRQVVHNLLRNARQAMPSGGTVRVGVSKETGSAVNDELSSNEWVHIVVADTGPGMDAEARARLFEPFFTTRSHGTGLGLAISRHIVEGHSGTIECKDNTPSGAKFIVKLPRKGLVPQAAV